MQNNLTTLNGARPTGLAHKKDIKRKQHKKKSLISLNTFHTNYPNPTSPLATNPHIRSNIHKLVITQQTLPKQKINHKQNIQQTTLYHHTCLANPKKHETFGKKSHNTNNTKSLITNTNQPNNINRSLAYQPRT